MGLQFDGLGIVNGYSITFTGDFSIDFPDITTSAVRQNIIGNTAFSTGDSGLKYYNDLSRLIFFADSSIPLNSIPAGTKLTDLRIERVGTTLTVSALGLSASGTLTGDYTLNTWGYTAGNQGKSSSLFEGVAEFRDNGALVLTHDFEQTPGSTVLPDTTGTNDATLSGFSTGGFVAGNPAPTITINTPTQYQCKKRNGSNQADFVVSGDITDLPNGAVVEYQLDAGTWATLDASPSTTFSGTVTVTDQQSITVRISTDTNVTDTVTHITAALVILAWWQSNEKGAVTNMQSVDGGLPVVPIMCKAGVFSALADPVGLNATFGSLWPKIASLYAADGIPVCVINVAVGGTSAYRWTPTAADLYPTITSAVTAADTGGINMSVSIGGERDNVDANSTVDVTNWLNEIVNQLNTDYGTLHYLTYWPRSDYATNQQIRDAFDNVIANNLNCKFGGDLQVMDISTGATAGNDGTHIMSDADAVTAATIRHTAFISINSSVTITATNTPNGSYPTLVFNPTNYTVIHSGDIAFTSGAATIPTVPVEVGTAWRGVVFDNNATPIDGAALVGVTE